MSKSIHGPQDNIMRAPRRFMQFSRIPELYNSKIIFEKVGEKIKSCTNKNRLFIYQRYSLNNFASILLSSEYNIPTVIEYNGSEVWIRENWGKEYDLQGSLKS